jgi:hypothetical protein
MALSTRELELRGSGLTAPLSTQLSAAPVAASLIAMEAAYPAALNPGMFGSFGAAAPYALCWSTGVVWKTVTIV